MSIEAMKQALDSLEQHGTPLLNHEDGYSASLTALRQAIAEAEKQMADYLDTIAEAIEANRSKMLQHKAHWLQDRHWMRDRGRTHYYCDDTWQAEKQEPVAWQERQARRMKDGVVTEWTNWYPCRYRTVDEARAEACDHIPYEWRPLYTHPPKREPLTDAEMFDLAEIAWRHGWASCRDAEYIGKEAEDERWGEVGAEVVQNIAAHGIMLTWVGLTEQEMDELVNRFARYELVHATAAKLREKNT